ncbi:MAG: hypothetical protein R6W90_10130 [Ignavibacteriaceae bacterium]
MTDLCIPVPQLGEQQIAEVIVKIGDRKSSFNFRVESFYWNGEDIPDKDHDYTFHTEIQIQKLKTLIESYDKNWELIQIFKPKPGAKYVQVLFRQRNFEYALSA